MPFKEDDIAETLGELLLDQFDGCRVSCRRCEFCIKGQKRHGESLGQRDIHGVVGRKICAQRPCPAKQRSVVVQVKSERRQIPQRLPATQVGQLPGQVETPQNVGDLDFDQARRMPGLCRVSQPRMDACGTPATEQQLDHNRGVEDDQRRSLSSRNTRTISERVATGRNLDNRARTSAGVGLSLDRCSSTSK